MEPLTIDLTVREGDVLWEAGITDTAGGRRMTCYPRVWRAIAGRLHERARRLPEHACAYGAAAQRIEWEAARHVKAQLGLDKPA